MKLESPTSSQKASFVDFKHWIFYNTEMNWIFFTAFGGINVPPGQFVCRFPSSAVLFCFFLAFCIFVNPSQSAAEIFFSTQLRKKTKNKKQSMYTVARLEPRGRSAESWTWTLEHDARFAPPASVSSWEEVTLIWHGYVHNEQEWLRGGAARVGGGVNVTAAFNPMEAGEKRKGRRVGGYAATPLRHQ